MATKTPVKKTGAAGNNTPHTYRSAAGGKKKNRKKKRRFNWKSLFLLIPAALIIAAIVFVISLIIKTHAPSQDVTDLKYYYNLSANQELGIQSAADDELAIVFEDEILSERAYRNGSEVYVRLGLITDNVDERFYYDSNEQLLIVTDALKSMTVQQGQDYYMSGDEQVNTEYEILTERNGEIYVAVDFACDYSSAYYGVYDNPSRVVITYKTGDKKFCDAQKKTQVRVLAGIKAEVVGNVDSGSKLQILDDLEDWYEVVSPEGWIGYVSAAAVGEPYEETVVSDYDEPEYTSLSLGVPVKLGWTQVSDSSDNSNYYDLTDETGGIMNVYSPTWYSLTDGQGGISIRSDADYVSTAHEDGYSVWALFSDTDSEYVKNVLTHTSIRLQVEDTVINDILAKGIDGLNIDFELINSSYGSDYAQFLRELSVRCRNAGIYFSVDNYAPYEYNACYHIEEQSRLCDYVIIMAYDDYVGSGEVGPNSSLPFIQEVLDMTLAKVTENKVVMALPFYSRVWTTSENGTLSRKEYSMRSAWDLMYEVDETPWWDDYTGMWYTEYEMSGNTVDAWIEDEETLKVKLELLSQYDLAGTAYWQLGQEYSGVWDVLAQY